MPESYTGDEGDIAVAAGLDVMDGGEAASNLDAAVNKTRDMLITVVNTVKRAWTTAVTAAEARTAMGIPAILGADQTVAGGIPTYSPALTLAVAAPTQPYHATTKAYVDAAVPTIPTNPTFGNVTATGAFYTPNSGPASGGYTVAYIESATGRLSRGASSQRYKENIEPADIASLAGVFDTGLDEFEMIGGDGRRFLGYIAEKLAANPATARFVVYAADENGDQRIESYDMISFLLTQCAVLHDRVKKLEGGQDA